MSTINLFQINMEIWGCVLCLVMAILYSNEFYQEGGAAWKFWNMLLVNALVLICDSFAYIYKGEISKIGVFITHISNFFVFFLEIVLLWVFVNFIHDILEEVKREKWLVFCKSCLTLQLIGLIITQFMPFYYYFDEENQYHRHYGILVSMGIMAIVLFVCVTRVFIARNQINQHFKWTFLFSMGSVIVCIVIQTLFYGFSLLNIGITLGLLVSYMVYEKEIQLKKRNQKIEELEGLVKRFVEDSSDEEA